MGATAERPLFSATGGKLTLRKRKKAPVLITSAGAFLGR